MAQQGNDFMERLRQIKAEREALGDKASGSTAPIPPSPVHPDRDPQPVPDKKKVRGKPKNILQRATRQRRLGWRLHLAHSATGISYLPLTLVFTRG